MSNEQREFSKGQSYLDGQDLRFDNGIVRATRERLRGGAPYQSGDVLPMFDETGKHRFVRLDVAADGAWKTAISGMGYERPVFNRESSAATTAESQLDKFTRGGRADVTALAHQLRWETTQLTTISREFLTQVQAAERTGDYSKVKPLPDEVMRQHLQEGAKGFFYGEPVEYQALLDAALEFTQWNKDRAELRAGIQLAELRTAEQLEQALRQVLGQEGIPVTGESTISGPVLHKYASRMGTGLRLAMATLECWYQEQGSVQLQRGIISE